MDSTKAGRLPTTMPAGSESKVEGAKGSDERPALKDVQKQAEKHLRNEVGENKDNVAQLEREQASSHSDSPPPQFVVASEQSKSSQSPASPTFNSMPKMPASPERGKQGRDQSRGGFFQNFKASRSQTKLHSPDPTIRSVQPDIPPSDDRPKGPQRTKSTPEMRETTSPDPIPDIPQLDQNDSSQNSLNSGNSGSHAIPRRPVGSFGGSAPVPRSQTMQPAPEPISHTATTAAELHEAKKSGGRLFSSFMRRNHHSRSDEPYQQPSSSHHRSRSRPSEASLTGKAPSRDQSATRSDAEEHSERPSSKSHKAEGAGSHLFREFGQRTAKAAKDLGKTRGRFFRSRNSSNTQQTPPDFTNYVVKVINLPLVEQTRITRIARRLEDSKDKTEFWMPALPWRCIDYLNFNGAEVEGLYRVPGSEREVRLWKARFDQEYDIDLFQEEELYDVNTIGSLFKSWLRDLPEDILPTSTQEHLSAQYSGEPKAPEEVKEILSKLPPWNYYLLFAITCHLSLLHAYQEKNKMTFHNLFVCFAPALRLNGDCFRWLVSDWRACWIGCATEKDALEEEYRVLDLGGPALIPEPNPPFIYEAGRHDSSASSVEATPRVEELNVPRAPASSHSHSPSQSGHTKSASKATSTTNGASTKPKSSGVPAPQANSKSRSPSGGHSRQKSVGAGDSQAAAAKTQGRRKVESPHLREGSRSEAVPREPTRDTPREPTREAPREPPREAPREPPREVTREPAPQVSRSMQNSPQARPEKPQVTTAHQRATSKLPELDLGQPISPTFTSK